MHARTTNLLPLAGLVAVAVLAVCSTVALAQQAGASAAGDFIAGQTSPWRSAHFVLYAYGAVWVGLALYVWRLAGLARRLGRELEHLEGAMKARSERDAHP